MSAEIVPGGLVAVDVRPELELVLKYMRGASVERKIAVVTWALDFLTKLEPATRAGVVRAAGDVQAILYGERTIR